MIILGKKKIDALYRVINRLEALIHQAEQENSRVEEEVNQLRDRVNALEQEKDVMKNALNEVAKDLISWDRRYYDAIRDVDHLKNGDTYQAEKWVKKEEDK